jgi:flavin reductase (DIM6/NTAB) family NADH-FMN oxidoreductase RutF
MYIELEGLSPNRIYATMTQAVIPRPIAWVLSDNGDGGYNLAPYSYFNAVSSEPPLVFISLGRKPDGSFKDSRINIEERRHFVVHIVHRDLTEPMVETSRTLPHGESEVDLIGLRLTEFEGFPLPRLEECRIALACELYEIKELGPAPQSLVFGKVRSIFVDDRVASKDAKDRLKIRAEAVDPIGRLGASEYVTFGEILSIPRPK